MTTISPAFGEATILREGAAGKVWIDCLPGLIDDLLERWDLSPEGAMHYGTVGVVLEVVDKDSRPLALKVSWQDVWSRQEGHALEAWAGRGAVKLLRRDAGSGALLLERLRASTSLDDLPMSAALEIAADVMRQIHVKKAVDFATIQSQWSEAPAWHPKYIEHLSGLASGVALVVDEAPSYLLHGDFHFTNVLQDRSSAWKAIDPKPVLGPREFDLIPLLRNRFPMKGDASATREALIQRLEVLVKQSSMDRARAELLTAFRALMDAEYAHRVGSDTFERNSLLIAEAMGEDVSQYERPMVHDK